MQQNFNNNNFAFKFSQIAVLILPALLGIFGFLNNVSGWQGTVNFAIKPLLAMDGTYDIYWQKIRAVDSLLISKIALFGITATETAVGVLNATAIVLMIKNFNNPQKYNTAKNFAFVGCALGVLVWGAGFIAIAGDFFLAWQSGGLNTQLGGLIYMLPCFLALIYIKN